MNVILPPRDWFFNEYKKNAGNVYSGSIGTSPERGGIVVTTFQYKAKLLQNEEDQTILFASYYFCPPWGVERQEGDCGERIFDSTTDGINEAVAWLQNAYEEGTASGKYKNN